MLKHVHQGFAKTPTSTSPARACFCSMLESAIALSSRLPSYSLHASSPRNEPFVLHTHRLTRSLACLSHSDKASQDSSMLKLIEMNPKITDENWQRERRKEAEEFEKQRQLEDEEEAQKTENYRQISKRMEGFDEEEVKAAKSLVASFIKAGEEVEEKIREAADEGKLTKIVLLVIYNRLELARHDNERHVIQALDLLYRRIEAEMLRREASPSIQFLDELLNLQEDGISREEWLRQCRQSMLKTFPREDVFSFLAPEGFDLESHQGPIDMPLEEDVLLLRVDFIREVDALLADIAPSQETDELSKALDPQSVALSLSRQQREIAIRQVRDLLKLAIELKW